ncbi:uncharacterized protein LOC127709384 [Mytilus californianus]|uniref:uncharacterized protein LOC127709384 n=1 Tax=Mytilus californianus TaxID=6549 RepID=UPI002245B6B9|nr:uncharacterized protein LOC127709384 [Mytilus californianus]
MQEVAITQEVGPSQHNDIDDVEDDYYEDDKDDRKMSVETCQVHYLTCKEKLYEIVNCQESTCDLADHVRHHEFVANPLKVQNRERVTVGFGLSVIKHRAMEYVHEKLSTDLLYNTGRDPKHPYTNRGTEMILGMKNGQLEKRFKVYRLGPQYLLHVLVKEMIVMIYMATHNSQYDKTNELCQETETNLTTECRKLKKQKINY